MKLILVLAATVLAVACGSTAANRQVASAPRPTSTAIVSPFVTDQPPAVVAEAPVATASMAATAPQAQPAAAPQVQPAAATSTATPVLPPQPPAPVPAAPSAPKPSPTPMPTAPPTTFVVVTVEGAPAMNCGTPVDCEASYAYAMTHFHVGDRLPYTRIFTDARGQRFYILGPFTPVGLLPVADGSPA